MGRRLIFCQKEDKLISTIESIKKKDNIYPAIFLKDQKPLEDKYRFRDIIDIAKNQCPACGGNLYFKYEEY